jgi:2-polyprenyl-3-methyl-5-hydroxy-6-metoxy-1,4-benzoquinol methylase
MNWNETLFLMAVILVAFLIAKQFDTKPFYEGFTQSSPFVLKTNNDIYDEFYSKIYDNLQEPGERVEYECQKIIEMTQPSEKSVILDVGSGTGHLVAGLVHSGYNAHGIEKSRAMIEKSKSMYSHLIVHENDVENSMAFDRGTFTHITCMNFTLYHIQDKKGFFRNCYYWLMPNSYLILHLVNKYKYDTTIPVACSENPQKYSKKRVKNTHIDFIDFDYNCCVDFKKDEKVVVKEKFTDSATNHVRENELTLYMEDLETIVALCQKCGFIAHGSAKFPKDNEQFIYVFEKQL